MTPVSAVIITFNEEAKISQCLDSLEGLVDEIVVVDSGSTDGTADICRSREVYFMIHPFDGFIEQKNFAMESARHDWILSLDADEVLSSALKASIQNVLRAPQANGYYMNRLNHIGGQAIRHAGWYPDSKLRLWNRKFGRFGGMNPHDRVLLNPPATTASLQGDLLHFTAEDIPAHKQQMRRFASIAAREMASAVVSGQKKKQALWFPRLRAGWVFFRRYFLQLGFLDGAVGFSICLESARYTFRKYAEALQLLHSRIIPSSQD